MPGQKKGFSTWPARSPLNRVTRPLPAWLLPAGFRTGRSQASQDARGKRRGTKDAAYGRLPVEARF